MGSENISQLTFLARKLVRAGQRPFIGDCLQCKNNFNETSCIGCWFEAANKYAVQEKKIKEKPCSPLSRNIAPSIEYNRIEVQDWPQAWQDKLAVTKKSWLCWTWPNMTFYEIWRERDYEYYMRVMLDCFGEEKKDEHTYWDCDDRDLFWSGIKEIGVRFVCAVGKEAALRIGLPEKDWRPLHWEIRNGIIIATLWDYQDMVANRYDDCAVFLKSTFKRLRL